MANTNDKGEAMEINADIASLRNEYVSLMNASGLSPAEFLIHVQGKLTEMDLEKNPTNFTVAARAVVRKLNPVVSDGVEVTDTTEVVLEKPKTGNKILSLPPSIVVIGDVSKRGAVWYETLEEDEQIKDTTQGHRNSDKTRTVRRVIENIEERKALDELYTELRKSLFTVCHNTVLGPVCAVAKEPELDTVIDLARAKMRAFNGSAQHHFGRVSWIKATIAPDDARFAKEITLAAQEVLNELKTALASGAPKKIREIINSQRIKEIVKSVPNGPSDLMVKAVAAARAAAKTIVKEVGEMGRTMEEIRTELDTSAIDTARMAFLEFSPPEEIVAERASLERSRFEALDPTSEPAATPSAPDVDRFKDME